MATVVNEQSAEIVRLRDVVRSLNGFLLVLLFEPESFHPLAEKSAKIDAAAFKQIKPGSRLQVEETDAFIYLRAEEPGPEAADDQTPTIIVPDHGGVN